MASLTQWSLPARAQRVVEVRSLPDWHTRWSAPSVTIRRGETTTWTLIPLGEASGEQVRGAFLAVRAGEPVTIRVTAARGYPVILLTDGPLSGRLQQEAAGDSTAGDELPGRPIGFAVGESNAAQLSILPPFDAVWQVWVCVRLNRLPPPEAEVDDSAMASLVRAGYKPDQVRALFTEPEFARACRP